MALPACRGKPQQIRHQGAELGLGDHHPIRPALDEGITKQPERHSALFRQGAAVAQVVVHAVIRGDYHLIPLRQPLRQQIGQQAVHAARLIAVLAGIEAKLVAHIVHPHRVDQQKIGIVLAAQPLAIHQQMAVGVVVIPVEAAVLDRQQLIVGKAIAGRQRGLLL